MDLEGIWYNELGSKMSISLDGKVINGIYQSKVGDAVGEYKMYGLTDEDMDGSQSLGWVVIWNNNHGNLDAVTTWCGQMQIVDGIETIITIWTLSMETIPGEVWKSTLIGKDIFTRTGPSDDQIAFNLKNGTKLPHPKKK